MFQYEHQVIIKQHHGMQIGVFFFLSSFPFNRIDALPGSGGYYIGRGYYRREVAICVALMMIDAEHERRRKYLNRSIIRYTTSALCMQAVKGKVTGEL